MSMNGVDVSAWQPGDILARIDYDFAYVKATEGTGYVSDVCNQQVQDARSRGKKYGVYHYASGGDANAEADYFCRNVGGYLGEGQLVLDWEGSALNAGGGWAATWVRRVIANTGVTPLIYTSESVASRSDMQQVADLNTGLWNANWNGASNYSGAPSSSGSGVWPFAVCRQYSDAGQFGYGGNIDLDVFYGDASVWDAYAKGGSPAPQPPSNVPTFPLPTGWWFGPEGGPQQSVSGWHGHRSDVQTLQSQLAARGFNPGAIDGYYSDKGVTSWQGSRTGQQVHAFQQAVGLEADGHAGINTWTALWS